MRFFASLFGAAAVGLATQLAVDWAAASEMGFVVGVHVTAAIGAVGMLLFVKL